MHTSTCLQSISNIVFFSRKIFKKFKEISYICDNFPMWDGMLKLVHFNYIKNYKIFDGILTHMEAFQTCFDQLEIFTITIINCICMSMQLQDIVTCSHNYLWLSMISFINIVKYSLSKTNLDHHILILLILLFKYILKNDFKNIEYYKNVIIKESFKPSIMDKKTQLIFN